MRRHTVIICLCRDLETVLVTIAICTPPIFWIMDIALETAFGNVITKVSLATLVPPPFSAGFMLCWSSLVCPQLEQVDGRILLKGIIKLGH